MFCEEILELFKIMPVTLPKPDDYINKIQMLLTDIVVKWFMYEHKSKLPPIKIPRMIKEA